MVILLIKIKTNNNDYLVTKSKGLYGIYWRIKWHMNLKGYIKNYFFYL